MEQIQKEILNSLQGITYAYLADRLCDLYCKYAKHEGINEYLDVALRTVCMERLFLDSLDRRMREYGAVTAGQVSQMLNEDFKIFPAAINHLENVCASTATNHNYRVYDWLEGSYYIRTMFTKKLRIGLVKIIDPQILLDIGYKESPTCYRMILNGNEFTNVDHEEIMRNLIEDTSWTSTLIAVIKQEFQLDKPESV